MILLARCNRGTIVETEHYGSVVIHEASSKLYGEDLVCYLRSAAKPLQLFAMFDEEILAKVNPTEEELALATASHAGTPYHVAIIEQFLKKHGLRSSMFWCKGHLPLDEEAKKEVIQKGHDILDVYNNCSGQHALMLAYCSYKNLPLKTYHNPSHSLQAHITEEIQNIMRMPPQLGMDGCGVPAYAFPLSIIAQGYISLMQAQNPSFNKILAAVYNYPVAFGGRGRLDTDIIMGSAGKLFAKVGAAGMVVVLKSDGSGAVVLKMIDGNNRIRDLYTIYLLERLGWFSKKEFQQPIFDNYKDLTIKSLRGTIVGDIHLHLPV